MEREIYIIQKKDMSSEDVLNIALKGNGFLNYTKAKNKLDTKHKEIEDLISYGSLGTWHWQYKEGMKQKEEWKGSKIVKVKLIASIEGEN